MRGRKGETIMETLKAVDFYHQQWIVPLLSLGHFKVKAGIQDIKSTPVRVGNQPIS